MYVSVSSARLSMHRICAADPLGLDNRCCEPLRGYWEFNSGPLEEQPVILTTDLSLQLVFFLHILKSFLVKVVFVCVKTYQNSLYSLVCRSLTQSVLNC